MNIFCFLYDLTDAHIHILRDSTLKGCFFEPEIQTKIQSQSQSQSSFSALQSQQIPQNSQPSQILQPAQSLQSTQSTDAFQTLRMLNGTCEEDWDLVQNAESAQNRVSFGIHPSWVLSVKTGWDERLKERLIQNPNANIGEIGLDGVRRELQTIEARAAQMSVFTRQLEIAVELRRAVSIHCVKAWDEMWEPLRRTFRGAGLSILFHAFSGTAENKIRFSEKNGFRTFYSFAPFTFRVESSRFQHLLPVLSLDSILLETDAETVAEAANLPDFYRLAAPIWSQTPEKFAETIRHNFLNFLAPPEISKFS